jgi:hypothetical protein
MRPLVPTGGPAVGKSTTGRLLAEGRLRPAALGAGGVVELGGQAGVPWWRSSGSASLIRRA